MKQLRINVAGLLVVGCAMACGGEPQLEERESPLAKVVFVGIDGATWDVIDPMIERGELPNFAKLAERGRRSSLISFPPLSSPIVWTTMATGTFPRSHGILGFTFPFGPSSKARPVDSSMRRDPAIWNIATAYGRRVGQVGYFVSHPPDKVDGFIITDRFHQRVPGSSFPTDVQGELKGAFSGNSAKAGLLGRFLPWDYSPAAAKDKSDPQYTASLIVSGRVDEVVERDEIYRRVTMELLDRPVDLFTTYFRVVDHSSHATWRYFDDSGFDEPTNADDKALLGGIIPEAYRYMDDMLGELVERCGDDTNIIIVSDHGFGPAAKDYEVTEGKGMVLSGSHRHDGIFLAAGPDIRQGQGDEIITVMDITPLLLALVGLPISDELPGRVIEEVLRPGFLEEWPIERVPAYDLDWQAGNQVAVPEAAEEDMLDVLQGLGYIDDDLEAGDAADLNSENLVDFWGVGASTRRHVLTGELTYYLLHDEVERARELLALTKERDPENALHMPRRVSGLLGAIEFELGREPGSLATEELLDRAGLLPESSPPSDAND